LPPTPGGGYSTLLQLGDLQGNDLKHTREIFCDVGIPKSQHGHATLTQPLISLTVSRGCFRMLSTVQLDGKLQCRTIEIQNVMTRGMLTAKARAIDLGVSQLVPKPPFDFGHIAS